MIKHRGYEIIKAKHPTPINPNRESYDIVTDGVIIRKANISTVETAKFVIDTMIKHRIWEDRSNTR